MASPVQTASIRVRGETVNNLIKTTLLMGALTGLIMLIGGLMGGSRGVEIAFIFSLAMNFFSYWFSDKIVLRAYNAKELTQQDAPELYSIVRELTTAAGTPMPRLVSGRKRHAQRLRHRTQPEPCRGGRDAPASCGSATARKSKG